jgi:hypothetical protein
MNSRIYKFVILGILLAAPVLTLAQSPSIPFWAPNGLVSCTGQYNSSLFQGGTQLPVSNPCTSLCDLLHTFVNIVYFVVTLALFVFTPILFAWGGIMILVSGGNPGRRDSAKKILTGTLIGLLIVLFAFLIVKEFVHFFGLGGLIPGFDGNTFNCSVL